MGHFFSIGLALLVLALALYGIRTVKEGTVEVLTMFGKYQRLLRPGLNFTIPFLEEVFKIVSTQNRTYFKKFQAITIDQANVYFETLIVYSVLNSDEDTIKKAAFKFQQDNELMAGVSETIQGLIRSFVAQRSQADILGVKDDLINYVKQNIDSRLSDWGYHLDDIQITDLTFDAAVLRSMEQVVAAENMKRIAAILKESGLDYNAVQLDKWMETLKAFAAGNGDNMLFMDGSAGGLEKTMQQMMGVMNKNKNNNP